MPGEFQEQRPSFQIIDPQNLAGRAIDAFNNLRALRAQDSGKVLGPTPADITASKTSAPSFFRTFAESRYVQIAAGVTVGIGGFFGIRSMVQAASFTRINGESWNVDKIDDQVYASGRFGSKIRYQVNGGAWNEQEPAESIHQPLDSQDRIVINSVGGNVQRDTLAYVSTIVQLGNVHRVDAAEQDLNNLNSSRRYNTTCIASGSGVFVESSNITSSGVALNIGDVENPSNAGIYTVDLDNCFKQANSTSTPTEVISTFTPTVVTSTATPTVTPGAGVKGAVCKKGPKAENFSIAQSPENPNEYTTRVSLVYEPNCTPKQTTVQVLREQRDERGRRVKVAVFQKTFFGEAARSVRMPYEITQSGKYEGKVVSETEEGKFKKDVLTPFKFTRTLWKKALNFVEVSALSPKSNEKATATPTSTKAVPTKTPEPSKTPTPRVVGR